jgi:hypothetical protein
VYGQDNIAAVVMVVQTRMLANLSPFITGVSSQLCCFCCCGVLQAMVQQEMSRVYGQENIAAVVMVHDTAALDAAAAAYCTLQEQFEDVLDWYQSRLPPAAAAADVEAPSSEQQQQQQQQWQGGSSKQRQGGLKRKTVSRTLASAADNS